MAKTIENALEDFYQLVLVVDALRELLVSGNSGNIRVAAATCQVLYQKSGRLAAALELLADRAETPATGQVLRG